jgi:hypothetical protein
MNIKLLPPLSRFLVLLLKIHVAVLVLAVIGDIYAWFEYSHLAPGVDPSEDLLISDILNLIVVVIQLPLAIFLGITFLRWIYRANANLHALSSQPMTFTPGWSVGWYFIPIMNLFKPYQSMKEIWHVAHGTSEHDDVDPILAWWWILWLGSQFIGRIALKLGFKAEDAASYTNSALADLFSDGIHIPLNIVAVILISRITSAYSENFSEILAAPPVAASTFSAEPPLSR